MLFLYDLINYSSYFFVFIIFLILSVICVKKYLAWILYLIGAVLTLISLLGQEKFYNNYYGSQIAGEEMTPYWIIYFTLLGVFAFIIFKRHYSSKEQKCDNGKKESKIVENNNTSESNNLKNDITATKTKKCKYCEKIVLFSIERCQCGCIAFEDVISTENTNTNPYMNPYINTYINADISTKVNNNTDIKTHKACEFCKKETETLKRVRINATVGWLDVCEDCTKNTDSL